MATVSPSSIRLHHGDGEDVEVRGNQEFTSAGDKVLVDRKLHARGRTTGIETEQRAYLVWTLHEGLVIGLETFTERGQALEAAGLRE
jgi:hypothetical protein